jgi:hypothetical protein
MQGATWWSEMALLPVFLGCIVIYAVPIVGDPAPSQGRQTGECRSFAFDKFSLGMKFWSSGTQNRGSL